MYVHTAPSLLSEEVYRHAAAVGRTAAGISGPNPPVGCLILRDGVVIAAGATEAVGGRHAERVALDRAGGAALGAIAVVTLEPCAHHGRTGPCVDALVAAGVRSVHVLHRDPDPVASGGMDRLRAAGVDVVDVSAWVTTVAAEVAHDLRGFRARVTSGRPHVTLKIAQTADGRTDPGTARYLTSSAARTRVHRMRSDVDAVLVGSGTVRADDPSLDVRHVDAARSPRPVVLATRADIDRSARIVGRGALVIVGPQATAEDRRALVDAGAEIVEVSEADGVDQGLDLRAALGALLERQILTVLAEPGPRLARALLAGGLVDDLELHIAGPVQRGEVAPAFDLLAPLLNAWDVGAPTVDADVLGGDVVLAARGPGVLPAGSPRPEHVH